MMTDEQIAKAFETFLVDNQISSITKKVHYSVRGEIYYLHTINEDGTPRSIRVQKTGCAINSNQRVKVL